MDSRTMRLGDVIDIYSGGTPSKKNPDYWNGDIPWVSAKSMNADRINENVLFISGEGLAAGSRLAESGTILLLTRGSGLFTRIPVIWVDNPVAYNQDIKCLKAKNPDDARFIYHWLVAQRQLFSKTLDVTGIGAGKINTDQLQDMKIYWPDAETRQRIAEIADPIIESIHLNRQINDYLDELATSLFDNWLCGLESSTTIGEIAQEILDYTKLTLPFVRLINSSDVTEGVFPNPEPVANKDLKGHFKKRFQKYDILYSEIRPRNHHYGYVLFDAHDWISTTRLMVIRNRPEMISSGLLYYYLKSKRTTDEFTLKTETRSGTFPQGKYADMASVEIPYAPVEFQVEISNQIEAILELIHANQEENLFLESLRDTLLPKLMSGEIDVSELNLSMQPNNH
ncbi:restriction endonuclease subunit S, partial [Slackia heliotrinireducens]|uniref:restriction endonuclease subunit S n=1 Tax=Slackia heliotrinireducens TaxID=84110 RepID=UPI0033158833